MTAKIFTLYESNFRDPVATLRRIADEIEAGEYGDVGTLAVALLGDTFEVFGAGEDSSAPSPIPSAARCAAWHGTATISTRRPARAR